MKIIAEHFIMPYKDDKYLLFVPFRNSLLSLISKDAVEVIQNFDKYKSSKDPKVRSVIKFLKDKKIIGYFKDKKVKVHKPKKVKPISMTLLPTLDCNYRCLYCYATGGMKKNHIDLNVAKKGVDLLIESCKKRKQKNTEITFHGGGEPLLEANWDFVESIVDYIEKQSKKHDIPIDIIAVSNGYFSKKQIDFVVKHFKSICISMDGPKEFQDKQRPCLNEKGKIVGSFNRVMRTLKQFDNHKFPYSSRVTLSKRAFEKFDEVVDFFMHKTNVTGINIEPIHNYGRQTQTHVEGPDSLDFAKEFIRQKFRAAKHRFPIGYSVLSFNDLKTSWCSACGSLFCLTPEKMVSGCLEVCHKEDKRTETFQYGYFDDTKGDFVFDIKKLQNLSDRNINNLPQCNDCIAKYFCAGSCPAKMDTMDIFDIDKSRTCEMNKTMIEEYMKRLFEEKDKEVLTFLSAKESEVPAY